METMIGFRCLFLLVAALSIIQYAHGKRNATEIIRRISRFSNKMVRPLDWTDKPTVVNVSLYISNFHAIDERSMEFSMDMFYRRKWNDPRLQYEDGPNIVRINPEGATDWFWLPDLFFPNARGVETHSVLKDNVGAWVKPNGDVKLSVKLSINIHCDMDLHSFPMDMQSCALHIESFMYGMDELDVRWDNIQVAQGVNPPAFFLLHVEKTESKEQLATGTYQRLMATFQLRRISGHYLFTTFLPTGCVVLLSCLIYWLPLSALSERTFFSAFLFLSMTVLLAASQHAVPQVGYVKAIDVWVVSCLLFLFFNVVEVIVLYLLARSAGYRAHGDQFELMKEVDTNKTDEGNAGEPEVTFLSVGLVRRVDWVLRILYPCAFVLFNIIFWSSCAN